MGCKGVAFGVAFGLALGLAMLTWADDEFIGQWTVKQAYQDREFVSTLTIGETSGTWTSRRGVSQLSKVNNTDGKLTFIRTFSRRGEEFTLDCEATIVDGKLVGKLATQMGDREFTATHVDTKPAVDPSGTWRWAHQDPASGKTVKNVLTIKSTGGDVSGSFEMSGAAFVVNNVIFDGNTLTWDHDLDVDGQALHLGFRGDISGDDLSGAVTLGDLGDFPWAAKRDSKVPADPSGTWRWEHMDPGTGQMIENALTLKVADGEVGGTFEMDGVTYQVNDPEVEGDTVSWDFDFGADGQYINISFYGHISGDSITGSFSVLRNRLEEEGRNQGTREFIRVLRLLEKHSITTVNLESVAQFPWAAARDVVAGETSKWIITLSMPDGSVPNHELTLTNSSGVYHADGNALDVDDFSVDGSGGFNFTLSVPEAGLTARFSGTSDGTSASGVAKYEEASGESGEVPFTAERSVD